MPDREREKNREDINFSSIVLRVILTAIVVGLAAFFTPGFSIDNIWTLLIAGVVISALNYLIERITGIDASPFGRGITGFIVAGVILYLTQFIVPGFNITILGAIVGALVVGVIDMIVPGKAM